MQPKIRGPKPMTNTASQFLRPNKCFYTPATPYSPHLSRTGPLLRRKLFRHNNNRNSKHNARSEDNPQEVQGPSSQLRNAPDGTCQDILASDSGLTLRFRPQHCGHWSLHDQPSLLWIPAIYVYVPRLLLFACPVACTRQEAPPIVQWSLVPRPSPHRHLANERRTHPVLEVPVPASLRAASEA